MNRAIAMLIIGLVFGGGLGFVFAASNGVTLDGHDHATDHGAVEVAGAHGEHDMPLVLTADDAPSVRVEAFPDPVAGWNLHIQTAKFRFSPENAGLAHVPGEGHAHVYAGGVKLGRVYGAWVHLSGLPDGAVEVTVTLNANDHRPLAVGDSPVSDTARLTPASGG